MSNTKIPFIGLKRLFEDHRDEYMHITESVLSSGVVVGGKHTEEFEQHIADFTNRKHAIAVNSCTDSLFFILEAAGIGEGDEVITTSYSFVATASPILRCGAVPVFVDIDHHYHLDMDEFKSKINHKTKAVIAVNLFGNCVNQTELNDICESENILFIEDAAQSFGSEFKGIKSGKFGIASALSFSPMKPLACFGTGGAILTDDETIAENCRMLRRHGKSQTDQKSHILGYNSVLPEDKAAQLNISFKYVNESLTKRNSIATQFSQELKGVGDLILPTTRSNSVHCWHKYVIRTKKRKQLKEFLTSKGIDSKIHYQTILPQEPIFAQTAPGEYPKAKSFADSCLSLPIYAELKNDEIEYIVTSIRSFFSSNL
jgi:dTDP-4-amino-4,6-dideoxygalactose transaminase